jgi:hypothetical protein
VAEWFKAPVLKFALVDFVLYWAIPLSVKNPTRARLFIPRRPITYFLMQFRLGPNLGPRIHANGVRSKMPKPKPDEYCAVCRRPGFARGGGKCGRKVGFTRICKGTMRSANNVGDWKECPDCGTTGHTEASEKCAQCEATGWVLARNDGWG